MDEVEATSGNELELAKVNSTAINICHPVQIDRQTDTHPVALGCTWLHSCAVLVFVSLTVEMKFKQPSKLYKQITIHTYTSNS